MPIRNSNWYDLQANRRYPLDERSTGLDDAGAVIRDNILVDCHIRFPATLGQYLYVQGVTVTPSLVSLVFGVAEDLETPGVTIAAVSLPTSAGQNIHHVVRPLLEGVAGWVVLGPGIAEPFVGRYSTPIQTVVAQRNGRPYQPLPIPTLGKLNLASSLEGIVTLTGAAPVTATQETVQVEGEDVPAIVFRLEGEIDSFNPLSYFLGPCGQRPESGTCGRDPIETINGVTPDCNGNINIVFEGFTPLPFEDCGGVDVLASIGLSEACAGGRTTRRPPQDDCIPGVESIDQIYWDKDIPLPPGTTVIVSSESLPPEGFSESCALLPVCADFSSGSAADFVTRYGLFVFDTTAAPAVCNKSLGVSESLALHYTYAAADIAGRNIALFRNCASDWAVGKTIQTQVQLSQYGLERNGGIVFNYLRGNPSVRTPTTYLVAVLDARRSQLRLLRFNGTSFVDEFSTNMLMYLNTWYDLSVTPELIDGDIVVTVYAAPTDGSELPVTFSVPLSAYGDPIGQAGLFSDRAYSYFNKFVITEAS